MKKALLSLLLILSFGSYTFYKRSLSAADATPVIPPPASSPSSSQTPSTRGTSASSESLNPALQISQDPTPTAIKTQPSVSQPSRAPQLAGAYRDGSYTGVATDAFYGFIQVRAIITGGKLTDVVFIRYPNDRSQSIEINQQAMPYLKQEAISAQSAKVNIVSGATDSSEAFIQSLGSALAQAKS